MPKRNPGLKEHKEHIFTLAKRSGHSPIDLARRLRIDGRTIPWEHIAPGGKIKIPGREKPVNLEEMLERHRTEAKALNVPEQTRLIGEEEIQIEHAILAKAVWAHKHY